MEDDASMAARPRRRILVVNPNANEVVTKGLADALAPIVFEDGPEIECVTLKEGPYGIETQEHVDSVALPLRRLVAGSDSVDAFIIACFSDPGLHGCREVTSRPV
jgi:Asp/Glu/hydantoin racemase